VVAAALHRFATITTGILMAAPARSLPQFGKLSGADSASVAFG